MTPDALFARLPGMAPLPPDAWLCVDDDFAHKMALRDRLVAADQTVTGALDGAGPMVAEACAAVLRWIADDGRWRVTTAAVRRPDGVSVSRQPDGLGLIGRLVQEDVLIMAPAGQGYRLVAGVLCFPSRWRLRDKLGHPLPRIHAPVPHYDTMLARRVDRLFACIRPGAPLTRMNWLVHPTDRLDLPLGEDEPAPAVDTAGPYCLRTERQCLWRLPETGAVLFTIKTTATPVAMLQPGLRSALAAAMRNWSDAVIAYRGGRSVWLGALAACSTGAPERGA
jgi:hypothetical protein